MNDSAFQTVGGLAGAGAAAVGGRFANNSLDNQTTDGAAVNPSMKTPMGVVTDRLARALVRIASRNGDMAAIYARMGVSDTAPSAPSIEMTPDGKRGGLGLLMALTGAIEMQLEFLDNVTAELGAIV